MTNREKIRNMTDKQIAKMILNLPNSCSFCIFQHTKCYETDNTLCQDGVEKWLSEEAEEEAEK